MARRNTKSSPVVLTIDGREISRHRSVKGAKDRARTERTAGRRVEIQDTDTGTIHRLDHASGDWS